MDKEDPRWKLVERVAASASFQRSRRVRDFLLFISERAISDPAAPVREPEIRKAVFGRSADPDDPEDTLVRVQASQLRKRLQVYFSTEGALERLIIDVPKGSYTPVFHVRPVEVPADVLPPPAAPVAGGRRAAAMAGALLLLGALCIGLLVQNRQLRRAAASARPISVGPAVGRLWSQMFGDARVTVVVADGMLTAFQDLVGRQLTLAEYREQPFDRIAGERLGDKAAQAWAKQLMNREYTSIADALLIRRVATVNALQGRVSDVVLARHADVTRVQAGNVVLSGSLRANPWLELFEPRLNFRSRFEEASRRSFLDNTAPLAGEQAAYAVVWNHVGYCRVAYLPGAGGKGSVLLLTGTDVASSDAGSAFVTDERSVADLMTRLGVGAAGRIPYFEVLLRAAIEHGTAPRFEIASHRIHTP